MKSDRRVVRSKQDMKNAFLSLLSENHNIKKVTINMIVEKANYNRVTFYAHFADKEAFIQEIRTDAIEGFISAFRDPYIERKYLNIQKINEGAIKIFNYVENNKNLFKLLFDNRLFPNFQKDFAIAIEQVYFNELNYLDKEFQKINKKLFTKSSSYLILGLINSWIELDFEPSAQTMTEQMLLIIQFSPNLISINEHN